MRFKVTYTCCAFGQWITKTKEMFQFQLDELATCTTITIDEVIEL